MAESIFFTDVDASVTGILDGRGAAYSATNRTSPQLNWLLKKTAYARAGAKSEGTGNKASLFLATKGGLGSAGLYQKTAVAVGDLNNVAHYRPDPHLNSVKVSSAGDFGSIIKVEVAFTVYSLSQLNDNQAFFDINGDLSVDYGWNDAGGLGGKPGAFSGKIYNFSYTLNDNGGFDCTSFAMGNGLNVLGLSAKAAAPLATIAVTNSFLPFFLPAAPNPYAAFFTYKAPPTPAASVTKNVGNVTGRIKNLVDAALKTLGTAPGAVGGTDAATGIVIMSYDKDVIGPNLTSDPPPEPDPDPNKPNPKPNPKALSDSIWERHAYISLDSLTGICNAIIAASAGKLFSLIVCDAEHPFQNMPSAAAPGNGVSAGIVMVSADPAEIVFPGYATYSAGGATGVAGTANEFSDFNLDAWTNGPPWAWADKFKLGQLNATLINVEFLNRIFSELGSEKVEAADETFSALFSKIFQSIYKNSGNRFSISLVSNPKNPNQVLMVDVNYVNPTKTIFQIKAVTDGGFCRSISLASKVPQEMASAAMVAATSTAAKNNPSAIKEISGANAAPNPAGTVVLTPTEAVEIICNGQGFTTTNIEGLRSAMQSAKVKGSTDPTRKDSIIYPIEFSATMDGIEGFVFGNTVSCNYLPLSMKNDKIVHTILNVEHDISNSDWTTSITTVCRLLEQ